MSGIPSIVDAMFKLVVVLENGEHTKPFARSPHKFVTATVATVSDPPAICMALDDVATFVLGSSNSGCACLSTCRATLLALCVQAT